MSDELDAIMQELFQDQDYTIVKARTEIECPRDILNVYRAAHGGDVHPADGAIAGVLKTIIEKNCNTKTPDTKTPVLKADLDKYGAANELVYLNRLSILPLTTFDGHHAADPTAVDFREVPPLFYQKLGELQASLNMLMATYNNLQLHGDGSPMILDALDLAMPGYELLIEWLREFPHFVRNLVNRVINRMQVPEFLDMPYSDIRDGLGGADDKWLACVLAMRVFVIIEPARTPYGLKEFDLTNRKPIAGGANDPLPCQGDPLPFDAPQNVAPKTLSVCQKERGPDYKVLVQVLELLAAKLQKYIVVDVSLVGETNSAIFGHGPHRFKCGDNTNDGVLVLWMQHNSDDLTTFHGHQFYTEAAYYGVNDPPEAAKAAFGGLMLRMTHAALVVRY